MTHDSTYLVIVFGKCIHSLSKIGEEVYFEPLDHGLALRTVSPSRSAYACFVFAPGFFLHYDDGVRPGHEDEEAPIKCKIGVKSCLTVFRSLATLEKTVDRCVVTLNMSEARLVFQLHCRHGIVKTHNLAFIECETLQAVFSKDMTPNKLTAQSRLLCDAVVNFQSNQEEVTLCVTPERVLLKNYVEDEPDPHKVIRTELGLDPEEFDNFQVGIDCDVTFCLKELRAILAFSDSANIPVSINFEGPGRPIVFSVEGESTFEANFVLATLADLSQSQSSSQQSTQTTNHVKVTKPPQNQARSVNTVRKQSSKPGPSKAQVNGEPRGQMNGHMGDGDVSRFEVPPRSYANDTSVFVDDRTTTVDTPGPSTNPSNRPPTSKPHNVTASGDTNNENNRSIRSSNPAVNKDRVIKQHGTGKSVDKNSADSISPVIPLQQNKKKFGGAALLGGGASDDDTASEEEELVPGTPPAKKFKSLFFGLSQDSTQSQTKAKPPAHRVLAEDTDEDD